MKPVIGKRLSMPLGVCLSQVYFLSPSFQNDFFMPLVSPHPPDISPPIYKPTQNPLQSYIHPVLITRISQKVTCNTAQEGVTKNVRMLRD